VLLDGVRNDRMVAAYFRIVTTGMRRGEALGLRWADVDLDAGRAAIRQTLVTVNLRHGWATMALGSWRSPLGGPGASRRALSRRPPGRR